MSASRKNSADDFMENSEKFKPVSVCSVSFAPLITEEERDFIMQRLTAKRSVSPATQAVLKKFVFNWRNAAIAAAILTVGIAHFAFQMSFIRSEVSKNDSVTEMPSAVETAPVTQGIQTIAPAEMSQPAPKKNSSVPVSGKASPAVRRPQAEIAPVRQQPKRRDMVETREERLRRVEKMLTGI